MIRTAQAGESDAVCALVRDAYGRWVARFGREPSPMRDDYARRIADGQVWMLDGDGEIVGLIVLKDGLEALMISNIAVAPAAQGKGHGRRLLAFAAEEATRRGLRRDPALRKRAHDREHRFLPASRVRRDWTRPRR